MYDIEVQRSDAGEIPRRARFHNAMVDVRMLNENQKFKEIEDPIGRLVHDFGCVRSADMYNDLLKQQVHYFKETEGGKEEMCEIIENVAEKKAEKTKIDCIKNLMQTLKLTAEQAMDALMIPAAEQAALIKKI